MTKRGTIVDNIFDLTVKQLAKTAYELAPNKPTVIYESQAGEHATWYVVAIRDPEEGATQIDGETYKPPIRIELYSF